MEPSPPTQPRLPTHLAWALTLVATFTMSISYVDRQAFAILAPSFTKELGIADDVLSRLLATFSIAYLIGAPLAGRFIDAVGARRGLLGAVLAWSVVAALHALAPGVGVLFGLRIALGLAESPSFPGSAQTVNRALPPADRSRGFGILFTGSSIGAMLVAPLASRLAAAYGWRTAFVLTAVIGLCWVPVWLGLSFHPACRAVLDRRDEVGHAAAPRPGIAELLRHRDVQRAILLVLATAPGIAFVLNLAPTFLAKHHGLDQKAIGNYLWFPPIMFDVGAVLFGDLSARARRRRGGALAPDRGLIAVGALLASTLAAMPLCPTPISAVAVAGVALLGGGGVYALLTADMMARVPPAAVASAGGITAAAQSITHIVGLPLVGHAATSLGGYDVPVMVLGAWVIPATLLWLRIRPGELRA